MFRSFGFGGLWSGVVVGAVEATSFVGEGVAVVVVGGGGAVLHCCGGFRRSGRGWWQLREVVGVVFRRRSTASFLLFLPFFPFFLFPLFSFFFCCFFFCARFVSSIWLLI